MEVTQAIPDGAALSALNGDWTLAHDAASGRFTRRFAFALPTGGLAERIRWQPDTGFTLSFPSFDYSALAAGGPESAATANSGSDGVRLTFPVPRTLLRVKIAGAQSGDTIEAHRVDGNAITEDAFAHASHGRTGAMLNVADRQFVLRQRRNGAAVNLRTTDVEEVVVRSAAANLRVGIILPGLGNDPFYLGPKAGVVLTNPATAANLGPALAALLQGTWDRFADSLGSALLPASVPMTLIVESDTPARAHISGFALRYRLARQRFGDLAPKRVFAFPGGAVTSQPLTLDVPRGATLWSATLRMTGPFQKQPEEEPENGGPMNGPPPGQAQPSDLGIELRAGEAAATRIVLPRAALLQGATLELVALAETSAGRVRLHQDVAGKPGEPLGEAAFAPLPAGVRRGVRVDFERASLVSAGPVWVAAQCDNGALLWLTNEPGDLAPGGPVVRRAAGDVDWTGIAAASDRGAAAAIVTAPGAEDVGLPARASAFHGVLLQLGGVRLRGAPPVPGSAAERDTRFNIAAAIQPLLQSGASGALATVSLSLVSSEPGRVTVYPPEFEFDP